MTVNQIGNRLVFGIANYLRTAATILRTEGCVGLVRAILEKFVELLGRNFKRGVASGGDFLELSQKFLPNPEKVPAASLRRGDSARVDWLLSDWSDHPSGGMITIFRIASFLAARGFTQKFWILRPKFRTSPASVIASLGAFPQLQDIEVGTVFEPHDCLQIETDALIATEWRTAYPARTVARARHRFYLVQDHEPDFFAPGAEHLLAAETYRFGFTCLAASPWLASLLRERYGADADGFLLGVDLDVYHPVPHTIRSQQRLAVYARYATARRAVELALAAVEIAARQFPGLHVDFFGGDISPGEVSYTYTNHGFLSESQLADLYRQCTIGIVFSCTNYSLVPNEMMACGCPVIELDSPCIRAIYPADVITKCRPEPRLIAAEIVAMLRDKVRRETQTLKALKFVEGLDWETTLATVSRIIQDRCGIGPQTQASSGTP